MVPVVWCTPTLLSAPDWRASDLTLPTASCRASGSPAWVGFHRWLHRAATHMGSSQAFTERRQCGAPSGCRTACGRYHVSLAIRVARQPPSMLLRAQGRRGPARLAHFDPAAAGGCSTADLGAVPRHHRAARALQACGAPSRHWCLIRLDVRFSCAAAAGCGKSCSSALSRTAVRTPDGTACDVGDVAAGSDDDRCLLWQRSS